MRLDVKMSVRYTKIIHDRKSALQTTCAILIPFLGSGTIAVWLFANGYNWIYALIGILITALSVVQTALKLGEAIPKLRELTSAWMDQERLWDELWGRIEHDSPAAIRAEIKRLRLAKDQLDSKEGEFRRRTRLIRRVQLAVRRAEGLTALSPPNANVQDQPALDSPSPGLTEPPAPSLDH